MVEPLTAAVLHRALAQVRLPHRIPHHRLCRHLPLSHEVYVYRPSALADPLWYPGMVVGAAHSWEEYYLFNPFAWWAFWWRQAWWIPPGTI